MKVTLKYEEGDDKEKHMLLRITLPQKYVNGQCREVVKLFVDHYNKKHTEDPLDIEALHLKIVGGDHLDNEERVRDMLAGGDECYLLPEGSSRGDVQSAVVTPAPATKSASSATCTPCKTESTGQASSASSKANANGMVRCKNFGCQRFYDPNGPPQECRHHKAPPTFHEVAKWWSCCPDRKAYDFEDFMAIPGCTTSVCTNTPEGQQGKKKFLGGSDLRGDSAPVRLDADAPTDPRHKLDAMRKGLIAIGCGGDLFDKVLGQAAAETNDLEKVCDQFRSRFAAVLNNKDL